MKFDLKEIVNKANEAYFASQGIKTPEAIRKIGPNDDDWKCRCGAWNVHWAQRCVRCGDGLDVEPPDHYEEQP